MINVNTSNSTTYVQIHAEQFDNFINSLLAKLEEISSKVDDLTINNISKDKDLISADELCDWLNIAKITLWRYEKLGKFKAYKIGKNKMYSLTEVKEAFANNVKEV